MKIQDCLYKDICQNECHSACIRYVETKFLLQSSNIPESKQKVNKLFPDDCDIPAFEELSNIRDSVCDFVNDGKTLYIYSTTCGNGKTTWAIKIMLQYFNEVWAGNGFTKRGLFVNVPTFLSMCKSTISHPDSAFDELRADITKLDLVIFDDIASTRLSEYDYNTMLNYIDQRVLNEKATIYTGNIVPKELSNYLGTRLASRVAGNNAIKIMLRGGDMR